MAQCDGQSTKFTDFLLFICNPDSANVVCGVNHLQTGFSSAPGVVQIESYDVFSRKHEAHVVSAINSLIKEMLHHYAV